MEHAVPLPITSHLSAAYIALEPLLRPAHRAKDPETAAAALHLSVMNAIKHLLVVNGIVSSDKIISRASALEWTVKLSQKDDALLKAQQLLALAIILKSRIAMQEDELGWARWWKDARTYSEQVQSFLEDLSVARMEQSTSG